MSLPENVDPSRSDPPGYGPNHQPSDAALARQLSEFARQLQDTSSAEALYRRITAAAVRDIAGADWASITLQSARELTTQGATDPLVDQLDLAQYDLDEGPCLDASRRDRTIRVHDLAEERRWPRFAAVALAAGVRSMLSVTLFLDRGNVGALNLYGRQPEAFNDLDEAIALLLASHAALALAGHDAEQNLIRALDVRDLVGQAKGMLMERYKVDAQAAFALLSLSSQNTNQRLTEVARKLTVSGELPLPPDR